MTVFLLSPVESEALSAPWTIPLRAFLVDRHDPEKRTVASVSTGWGWYMTNLEGQAHPVYDTKECANVRGCAFPTKVP